MLSSADISISGAYAQHFHALVRTDVLSNSGACKQAWPCIMHIAALPNSSGTWSTCTALPRLQWSSSGVIAREQTRINAISMFDLRDNERRSMW
jgi:hypothetical protein